MDEVPRLDPIVLLSTAMQSQPGVYALLIGSGVSTGAGIPTGWGVVKDLVRRCSVALDPDANPEVAAADPEAWWAEHGEGELGYSSLLATLAPTRAARRGLLAGYFEPTENDAAAGRKVPGPAHRAIAELVRRGVVRVVVTTNFDRLVERALEDAGVPPQVVSRPDAVRGLTPLPHAAATVVKLHGDYADLDMRNTVDELDTYPAEWDTLLARIFDEYGLLISGWSGDWDSALVRALERVRQRRYPLYWDSRSSEGEVARRLLAQHGGIVVRASDADDLFTGVVARVDALARLTEPPMSTAMAVERLKRVVLDPIRRVELTDLVIASVERCVSSTSAQAIHSDAWSPSLLEDVLAMRLADALPVLHLVVEGVRHDRAQSHTELWIDALQRLMNARTAFSGTFNAPLEAARHYPALLFLRAAGVVATVVERDNVLVELLSRPTWRAPWLSHARIPAVQALHDYRVVEHNGIVNLPRWGGTNWLYPASVLTREDLRDVLRPLLPDERDYKWAHDRYEYRIALAQFLSQDVPGAYRSAPGNFIGDLQWDQEGVPLAEVDFRSSAATADDGWPWFRVVERDKLDETLTSLRDDLKKMGRWG